MTTTGKLGITHLVAGQASAEVKINAAWGRLTALIGLSVRDSAPPAAPPEFASDGAAYVVPASATGAWASFTAGNLAVYDQGWVEVAAWEGLQAWDEKAQKRVRFKQGQATWVDDQVAVADLSTFTSVGTFGECDTIFATLRAKVNELSAALRAVTAVAPANVYVETDEDVVAVNESVVKVVTAV